MKDFAPHRWWLIPMVVFLLTASPATRAEEPEEPGETSPSPAAAASPAASPATESTRPPGQYKISAVPLASKGRQIQLLNAALRSANKRIATLNGKLSQGAWYKEMRQTIQGLLDDLMVAHTVHRYKPAGEKARNVVILFKSELIEDDRVRYLSGLGPIEIRVDPKPKTIESWNYSYLPVGVTNTRDTTLTKSFMQYLKFYVVTVEGFQDRALQAEDIGRNEELAKWVNARGGITKFTMDEDLLAKSSNIVHLIFPRRLQREDIAKVIAVLDYPNARAEAHIPLWENIKDSDWPKFI